MPASLYSPTRSAITMWPSRYSIGLPSSMGRSSSTAGGASSRDVGVAILSVASAVSDAAISRSNLVTVPMAIAVRAASSGGGVEVP
jgi:hypothetical protein